MKREKNEFMKSQILDAVIACKIDAAGSDVSLSQIASYAGISERTLNRYFPDKEILQYDAAIRYLKQEFISFSELYLNVDRSGINGLQRLRLLFQMLIEYGFEDLNRSKVFVRAYSTAIHTAIIKTCLLWVMTLPYRKLCLAVLVTELMMVQFVRISLR